MPTAQTPEQSEAGRLIHQVLAHSYLIYLGGIVLGVVASLIFPVAFSFPLMEPIGMALIMAGTFLIVWAQRSSLKGSNLRHTEKVCRDHFCVGPYVFTRLPTQYGLSLMGIGLGLLYGSIFVIFFSIVAFLIGRFVFVPKQEHHLAVRYGEAYLEYKKHVRF